jgi:hypothetical protein
MRKLLLLLAIALPAAAQQQTISAQQLYFTNSVPTTLVATNDAVCVPLDGQQWASAMWTVATAGSGGITTEYTNDPSATPCSSLNFLPSAYAKRLDQASANPSTSPWANNTPIAGRYETPLPGNATAFRIRYQTAGTATVITLAGGAVLVPGVPVVATLWDVTSAVNTAIDTGILELGAGWASASAFIVTPAAGSGAINVVDDAGTSVALHTVPASATVMVTFALGGPSAVTAVAASGTVPIGVLSRRMRFTTAAVAAVTSRIRVEVRR